MKVLQALSLAIFLVVPGVTLTRASEMKLNKADLPPAVRKAADHESRGATVRGYSKEVENGKTTYEVELMVNGHAKDVSMDPSGAVVEVEEVTPLESLPAAAREAIVKGAGSGKIIKVEAISNGKDPIEAYEASVRTNGKHSEVRVKPDGSRAPED